MLTTTVPFTALDLVKAYDAATTENAYGWSGFDLPNQEGCETLVRAVCGLIITFVDGVAIFLH